MRPKSFSLFREPLHNERGMALLVTVMVVSLLIAMTVHLVLTVRQEIEASTHAKQRSYLQATARSGLQWGVAALEKDSQDNLHDALLDDWAKLEDADFSALFGRDVLDLKITDLSRKLQINSLDPAVDAAVALKSRDILTRLLELNGIDPTEVPGIIDAIVDWIDIDDNELNDGAEDSYYHSLDPPYDCKNGPIEFVDELYLIKGIREHPEIFEDDPAKKKRGFLTAHGSDGKININTADLLLLQAMKSNMTPEKAEEMDAVRIDEARQGLLAPTNWYETEVPSMAGGDFLDPDTVTTASRFFQIDAIATINKKAKVGGLTRKIRVIVDRDQKSGTVTFLTRTVE